MEETTTVELYDHQQRVTALEQGTVLVRTHAKGVVAPETNPQTVFVWVDPPTNQVLVTQHDGQTQRVTVELLDTFLPTSQELDTERRIVVPDQRTGERLLKATNAVANNNTPQSVLARSVQRRLLLALNLSHSGWVVVLTQALARKYWLPAGQDESDPMVWANHFVDSSPPAYHPTTWATLLWAAHEGEHSLYAAQAFNEERYALVNATFPGPVAAISAYKTVTRLEEAVNAWGWFDPTLRERNVLVGDINELNILTTSPDGFTATASQPFRLRTDRPHRLLFPGSAQTLDVDLGEATMLNGEVIVEVSYPATRAHSLSKTVDGVHHNKTSMWIAPTPFLAPPSIGRGLASRWVKANHTEQKKWVMPPNVAMNGAE